MPPYISVNQDDIDTFYKRVDMWIDSHGGTILSSILFDYAHILKYFYGNEFKNEVINERYINTGKTYNGYDVWRKKDAN